MIDRCHRCRANIAGKTVACQPPVHYHIGGPFPCQIDTCGIVCPTCHAANTLAVYSKRPMEQHSWAAVAETMTENRDFVYANTRQKKIDGTKPLAICWAWTPLLDDEKLADAMVQAIKADEDLRRGDRQSVLVMEFDAIIPRVMEVLNAFDSCILLKRHVSIRPRGPYASLRAERSIQQSWTTSLAGVKHYWPSASLSDTDYVPLDTAEGLARAWGRYSRLEAVNRLAA